MFETVQFDIKHFESHNMSSLTQKLCVKKILKDHNLIFA